MLPTVNVMRGNPVVPCPHCHQPAPTGWWGVATENVIGRTVWVAKHRCPAADGAVIDVRQPQNLSLSRLPLPGAEPVPE